MTAKRLQPALHLPYRQAVHVHAAGSKRGADPGSLAGDVAARHDA